VTGTLADVNHFGAHPQVSPCRRSRVDGVDGAELAHAGRVPQLDHRRGERLAPADEAGGLAVPAVPVHGLVEARRVVGQVEDVRRAVGGAHAAHGAGTSRS
jgi:hypothetical protein